MIKVFLVLRTKKRKSIIKFIEGELDRFLSSNGFVIVSYEVRPWGRNA